MALEEPVESFSVLPSLVTTEILLANLAAKPLEAFPPDFAAPNPPLF